MSSCAPTPAHEHATTIKLGADVPPAPVRLTSDVSGWAEEVLLEFGGSARSCSRNSATSACAPTCC